MDAVDIIQTGKTILPIISAEELPVDVLDRQELVDQIMLLLNTLSDTRGSCTFALNGSWGTGKTFVLNMLERQLRDYQAGDKFIVFHYNCWQYDYYEEPLIAIVAAMYDSIDEQSRLLTRNARETLVAVAKPILKKIIAEFAKNKLGFEITDMLALISEGTENAKEMTQDNAFDSYCAFKRALITAKEELRTLATDRTLVIVVDELDRCLPSYAIKVLERLHHLFNGLENTEVILAVDKQQLDNTVKKTFGDDTETDTYLRKFIDFEVKLDVGSIQGGFREKYADYVALFEENAAESGFSFDKFIAVLFHGVDIRKQERIVGRIKTIHQMLFPNERKDFSFMCFELLWMVLTQLHNLGGHMPIVFDHTKHEFRMEGSDFPAFSKYMKEEWTNLTMTHTIGSNDYLTFTGYIDVPQLLIYYLWEMYPHKQRQYRLSPDYDRYEEANSYLADFKKIKDILRIVK